MKFMSCHCKDPWIEANSTESCTVCEGLTHWGRVTHICVSKLTIIGSGNGLSPDRCQAIIWTNVGLLFIAPLGTNSCETIIEIIVFSFKKMRLKVSSAKRRPFCLGLNVLSQNRSLPWHRVSIMAYQITGNSTFFLNSLFKLKSKRTSKFGVTQCLQQWLVDFPYKEPVTQKAFPYNYIIMCGS